jgi:hypothetical protein
MGDSCARVRVRVLAHHPSDVPSQEDSLMSFHSQTTSPTEPVRYDDVGLHPNWSEHMVTVVATSIALLIVAVIAVLMGMA